LTDAINNLAVIHVKLGEFQEARALVAEALPVAFEKYGPKPELVQVLIRSAIHLDLPLPPGAQPQQ
jgi:hypothetical protein